MEPLQEAPPEDQPEDKTSREEDVFDYLVDESPENVDTKVQPESSLLPVDVELDVNRIDEPEPDPVPYPDDEGQDMYFPAGSFHSDSGVSMDDGSFTVGKALIQPLLSTTGIDAHGGTRRQDMWPYPEVPKPRAFSFEARHQEPIEYTTEARTVQQELHARNGTSPSSVFTESDPLFPLSSDHLASELAGCDSPPLFRAFRKTNYRILLQLQDEITELQEDLAELDVYDGSRRLGKDPTTSESLRKLSFAWGQCDFDLYKAKADVLGKLQIRMDQYCSWIVIYLLLLC
jgi:hypothetical protein